MPNDEYKVYKSLCKRIRHDGKTIYIVDTPQSLEYMLSRGYDMFKLIKKKQAFDAAIYSNFNHPKPIK